MNIDNLILYRNFKYQNLLKQVCDIYEGDGKADGCDAAHTLIELASRYGFEGNLWHDFLAFCLANHENAYSTSCEIVGQIDGSLNAIALHDMKIMRELYEYDLTKLPGDVWIELKNYKPSSSESKVFNKRVRDNILKLAQDLEKATDEKKFKDIVTEFYKEFGVGKFGLNKAFRVEEDDNQEGKAYIEPITRIEHIYMKDIVGYELQKEKLISNTESFIKGMPANNVLLYGDAGTGKSSSVKAIVNEYYDKGLRIIEVYKHQFRLLSDILEQVKDRNYKFIIYMDDLSFEDSELEYKYLKAILEGGLGKRPANVLIYATSNRRHLIRESYKDKTETDEEMHTRDTVQEKLSLSARFGVTIYYGSPDKNEFQKIVKALAVRNKIDIPDDELFMEANKWELAHGGLSGRTASQFITYLQSRK